MRRTVSTSIVWLDTDARLPLTLMLIGAPQEMNRSDACLSAISLKSRSRYMEPFRARIGKTRALAPPMMMSYLGAVRNASPAKGHGGVRCHCADRHTPAYPLTPARSKFHARHHRRFGPDAPANPRRHAPASHSHALRRAVRGARVRRDRRTPCNLPRTARARPHDT